MRFLAAAGLDIVMVLVFAVVGRSSHGEADSLAGVLTTAWPFLVAAVTGSLIAFPWRKPYGWRTGIVVWVTTVVLGMVLRVVAGGSTAVTFWIVAFISLGILQLGWRLVARLIERVLRRRRSSRDVPTGPRSAVR